jgi:hypothetical protein
MLNLPELAQGSPRPTSPSKGEVVRAGLVVKA